MRLRPPASSSRPDGAHHNQPRPPRLNRPGPEVETRGMVGARSSRWLLLVVLAAAGLSGGCDLAASTQDAQTAVGAGDAASDIGTQSSLRNALTAANVLFTQASS